MKKHLNYLLDLPLYDELWPSKEEQKDQFIHTGYIESLYNLIQECPTPFCLGLFGGWGSGKTGIVKGLVSRIKNGSHDKIRVVYFDVWKHSADSLRRQLLIKIDKEWHEDRLNLKNKLYVDTKKTTSYETSFNWKKFRRSFFWMLIPFSFIVIAIAYFQSPIGFCGKDWIAVLGTIIIPAIVAAISAIQGKGELKTIVEDTSKPVSPEEFERLFREALNVNKRQDVKNIFILDNLDRCQKERVQEVLTGISTFLEEKNCVYLIPCDDKRLKKRLNIENKDNDDEHYGDEFLRKLFNAKLYVRPAVQEQLLDYFNDLVKKIGIEVEEEKSALQAALQVGLSNNPRRVKQFLNNLVAAFNLALDMENPAEGKSSLPKGLITQNIGFLAKTMMIHDFFAEAFDHFQKNIGSYNEIENLIKEKQIDQGFKGDETLEKLLAIRYEDLTLNRFLDALSNISDKSPDIFFRFSGHTDLETVELVKDLLDSAMAKDHENLVKIFKTKSTDDTFMKNARNSLVEHIRAPRTSIELKANIISSVIRVNESMDDESLKDLTGKIVTSSSNPILSKVGDELNPAIWEIAKKGYLHREKIQEIARILLNSLNLFIKQQTKGEQIDKLKMWGRVERHLKIVNKYFDMFDMSVRDSFSEITKELIKVDIQDKNSPIEDLWIWLLPAGGDIPDIIKNQNVLIEISSSLGEDVNKQTYNAGILVSKLHKLTGVGAIDSLLKYISEKFELSLTDFEEELYPPNIAQQWIILSNKTFSSGTANQLFDSLIAQKTQWSAAGYDLDNKWIDGFIELYSKVDNDRKAQIRNIIENQIGLDPELYTKIFENNRFNNFKVLNYTALKAYALSDTLDIHEIDGWKKILTQLLEDIFNYNEEDINATLLDKLWASGQENLFKLGIYISEILSENTAKIKNSMLFVGSALNNIHKPKFWANRNEGDRKAYLNPFLIMMDDDKRISLRQKDDIIEPWLKAIPIEISDVSFKNDIQGIRYQALDRISKNSKKRCLNQIWTTIKNKMTSIEIDDPDLVFLMDHFEMAKMEDKNEIFDELFDQLNTEQPDRIDLFIRFGLREVVIRHNVKDWLENILPYIRQSGDTDKGKKIKREIKDKIDVFPDSLKTKKELHTLVSD